MADMPFMLLLNADMPLEELPSLLAAFSAATRPPGVRGPPLSISYMSMEARAPRTSAAGTILGRTPALETAPSGEPATGPVPTSANTGLSEREHEIAQLVLQGRTYAEIGAELFISPRTAEHHIGQIRRRLAATSRSDLLAKLRVAMNTTEGAGR